MAMEELYEKVFTELEKQRTEGNKKFFLYNDVGEIVSSVYDFYEDSPNEDIIEITQHIFNKYVEHLKTIYDDLEILGEDAVGLTGWDDYLEDEGICLGDDIEFEEDNQESLENAIDQLLNKIEMLVDDDI